jgi:hypothetical protein
MIHKFKISSMKRKFSVQNEDVDEIVQNMKHDMAGQQKVNSKLCHPIPAIFLDCFNLELFKACPKEKFIIGNSACVALKNYTNTCDDW